MANCRSCGKAWPNDYTRCPEDGTALSVGTEPTQMAGQDGAPAVAMSSDLPKDTPVGEYRIVSKLGEGGMGAVYEARHPDIGKVAAIKVISHHLTQDQSARDRFIQEAKAVNQIGHPNIVDIFSFGQLPDTRSFFVMELMRGESLAERLARGPLTLPETLEILDQVSDALEAAHEHQIVHRDLKPDNVFLMIVRGNRQVVKLLDFGIAKLTNQNGGVQKTQTGMMMGTPGYLSPEQARGRAVDHRTDIYALGCMLFEMVLGRLPFESDNAMDIIMKHLTELPPQPCSLWPEIPAVLDTMITRMLDKDPQNRPTLAEFRECVSALRGVPVGMSSAGSGAYYVPPPAGVAPRVPTSTPQSSPSQLTATQAAPPPPAQPRVGTQAALRPTTLSSSTATHTAMAEVAAPRRRAPLVAVGAAMTAALLGGGAFLMTRGGSEPGPRRATPAAPVRTAAAQPAPAPAAPATPAPAAVPSQVATTAAVVPAAPAPVSKGTIVITTNVKDARIEVDGRLVGDGVDQASAEVDADANHMVTVSAPGREDRSERVAVAAGGSQTINMNLERRGRSSRSSARPASEPSGDKPPGKKARRGDFEDPFAN